MNLLLFLSIFISVLVINIRNVISKIIPEVDSRIYFGEDVRFGEHKYLVNLDIDKGEDDIYTYTGNYFCSGSIIGENYIVTAAHCACYPRITFKAKSYSNTIIGYGNTTYSHPKFHECGSVNIVFDYAAVDVGLFKTENKIIFNQLVQPIPMSMSEVKLGDVVTIAGYGRTETEDFPKTPKQAARTVKKCDVPQNLFCTYGIVRTGPGDSGGPVIHKGQLIGITSCGDCERGKNHHTCISYYAKIQVLLEFMKTLNIPLITSLVTMIMLQFLSFLILVSINIVDVTAKSVPEVDSRVYSGEDVRPGEHRYLVLLEITYSFNTMTRCSGSIISEQWIATAAHCSCKPQLTFKAMSFYPNTIIGYGNIQFTHPNFKSCYTTTIEFHEAAVDVGLLNTHNRIIFNQFVQPIQMSASGVNLGDVITIAGYGHTETEILPNTPRQAAVTVQDCNVKENLLCSYGPKRTAPGDSGGPVTHNGKLVGITSSGICNSNICISYYAKIEVLLEFIKMLNPKMLMSE
ncbi:ovochymase-like [Plodia interpunctella]|uniref:ovochymase-like n=1 Tax=Plodia interpunctella TaxID=58824 RepID=UPI003101470D